MNNCLQFKIQKFPHEHYVVSELALTYCLYLKLYGKNCIVSHRCAEH